MTRQSICHIDKVLCYREHDTYTYDRRVVMDTPSLWLWFINSEIFHFRSTEDDVRVGFLDRGDELVWWPVSNLSARDCFS